VIIHPPRKQGVTEKPRQSFELFVLIVGRIRSCAFRRDRCVNTKLKPGIFVVVTDQ
jgi:hypothetical protein